MDADSHVRYCNSRASELLGVDDTEALGKTAGVNFVFDPDFRDTPITLDLRDVGFEQALGAVASVGHTFHRVLDSRVVMVIPRCKMDCDDD